MVRTEIIALAGSLGLMGLVLELVRRRRLKEKYSLLWLFTAVVLLVLSLSRGLMERVAGMMGIYYAPSAFFLLAFLFLMLITLQFSVVISKLSERNKILTQEVALLKLKLKEMEPEEKT
ncbi:MAG: DUF2304 domain-containing protein [Nitrospirae bacterium]|nr:DUF2304 domain-containing protein [Nitrospirota bacterium]MBI5695201.1 DUF2304 domain-containing protein [Nitrospirota bacterium]